LGPVYSEYDPTAVYAVSNSFGAIAGLPDGRVFTWLTRGKRDTPEDAANPDLLQQCFGRWSEDGGRTWSKPQWLFDFPKTTGIRYDGISLVDRDGVLHLFGLDFHALDVPAADPAKSRMDLYHVTSPDLGKTWSPVQRIDFGHTTDGMCNTAIQLRSGRIIVPVPYLSARTTGKWISTCVYSDDGGKTWQRSKSDLVVDSGHRDVESGACEPVVLELKDGRVWMLIRTQTGYLYEAFSKDGGETWSEPTQSRFIATNSPAHLLRLRDGRIILAWDNCSFGNLPGLRADRVIVTAAISDDEGKTWRGYREIARCIRSYALAYPWMVELQDGRVLTHIWFGSYMLSPFDPDWLCETSVKDDFSNGLDEWSILGTEGVTIADHPDKAGRKVLSLRKTNAEKAAAAVRNFPFGAQGRLDLSLRLEPGFQGARLCLTDFYSLPPTERKGRFGVRIRPDGVVQTTGGDGEDVHTDATVPVGKWFTLSLLWDCRKKQCTVLLDGARIAEAWQLLAPDLAEYPPNLADGQRAPEAHGVCYLRIWSTAAGADEAGMMIESLRVRVQ
jgi:hypothetical protein